MTTDTYKGDVDWFRTRSLGSTAGFFAPHLQPGISLLDCGCGPGSITIDFAEALAPGEVTGIDIWPESIDQARAAAAERNLTNVRFEVGDVCELPFPDATFDAVWVASTLQYIADPVVAAREMLRVLKPGGVLGARDRNHEGDIVGNSNPKIRRSFQLYYRWNRGRGIHLEFGGKLRSVLLEAGFAGVQTSASYESNSTHDRVHWTADRYAYLIPLAVEALGLSASVSADSLVEAWRRWGEDPRSYLCMARVEAVATKLA